MSDNHRPTQLVIDDTVYETQLTDKYKKRRKYEVENPKFIRAYIPGVIKKISVSTGQTVRAGDTLLILEAMKMQNNIISPVDGRIKAIMVELEQMVTKNQLLIELE